MTGRELEMLCRDAVAEAGADGDPLEALLRLMMRRDPAEGHHGFAQAVDRLRALDPDRAPAETVRGVARGTVALPLAWIGQSTEPAAATGIAVTLDGLSLSVNGKTVELTDPESLQTLADLPGIDVEGGEIALEGAHVVTQVNVQDEQGNVERRVIIDGEELDPAQLEERLAGLPEDVRRMLLQQDEEPGG